MWKNKKASMITISSEYITDMHNTQNALRYELCEAKMVIEQLEERIAYLEMNSS